ncbi:MAG: indole-3-glycerol phosphate synthase TrpC [Syntrophales bacterium]|nr:indole-3-glycerol phosphate synthase TrpC [Syntrophales bacterium]
MYLEKIIETKKLEIAAAKERLSMNMLVEMAENLPPVRSMLSALSSGEAIIAEIKRRSPSRGMLAPHVDVEKLASLYEKNGAKAISVLTDKEYFGGSLDDLSTSRKKVNLPVLRKDFIIDPYQIYESRLIGADCILLIADILSEESLSSFLARAAYLGIECLVEVHNRDSLDRALNCGANLIGINNRDLKTFEVDIKTTLELLPLVPKGITIVSESGIRTRKEIEELSKAGVKAFLIGETLMTAPDPGKILRTLLGKKEEDGSH